LALGLLYLLQQQRSGEPIAREGREHMAGTIDKAKGRIKEAAGVLADDPALKREGKLDQLAGDVKDGLEEAVDRVKNAATGKKGVRR
jgi:uncharacterized protein YjbJ (UPF0337 family)